MIRTEMHSRSDLAAALIAAGISIVVHLLIVFGLPEFKILIPLREEQPRKHQPVELSATQYSGPATEERPSRFRPENPAISANMPGQVEEFQRAISKYLVTPDELRPNMIRGEAANIAAPTPASRAEQWQPRQEIIQITERIAADTVDSPPRRIIVPIERVPDAPDIVSPVERPDIPSSAFERSATGIAFGRTEMPGAVSGGSMYPSMIAWRHGDGSIVQRETAGEITRLTQLDDLLQVKAQVYYSSKDPEYAYLQLDIERTGEQVLPVMPKDLILVQDSSASMTEQRLYFCRQGLLRCLDGIAPNDRFNIMYFNDKPVKCFDTWASPSEESLRVAREFIGGMESMGETDIFASLQALVDENRDPSRAVIAHVITDGNPTVGLRDSTQIIEQFSKLNNAGVSVFTMGTVRTANAYLLDLTAYRNRGDAFVVSKGRWDIPDSIQQRAGETARPVLAELRHFVSRDTPCEIYPARPTHLYLDRPLTLHGRYKRGTKSIVFQVVGTGREKDCDMVFAVDPARVASADHDIRTQWAWQKVYHLIGEHTRTRDPKLILQISEIARAYSIDVPYGLASSR